MVTLDAERARAAADAADRALAAGEAKGALLGLPMTVKDTFETAGLRTTCGVPELSQHVPAADAVAVARLRAAGAVVFGKTNTPTWAGDWQTTNPIYGTTNNPWDRTRTPGGSSGGSAAAVAAGFTSLELGSDIGGSIRVPAHCCGVFGHKPSHGLVPQRGHLPGAPGTLTERDLNTIGPLARCVDDLELALDVVAGALPELAHAVTLRLPPRARDEAGGLPRRRLVRRAGLRGRPRDARSARACGGHADEGRGPDRRRGAAGDRLPDRGRDPTSSCSCRS